MGTRRVVYEALEVHGVLGVPVKTGAQVLIRCSGHWAQLRRADHSVAPTSRHHRQRCRGTCPSSSAVVAAAMRMLHADAGVCVCVCVCLFVCVCARRWACLPHHLFGTVRGAFAGNVREFDQHYVDLLQRLIIIISSLIVCLTYPFYSFMDSFRICE